MSTNQFEIDTSDYLGYKYDQYVDKLYAMALSKTSDYLGFKYEEYKNELYSLALSKPSDYLGFKYEEYKNDLYALALAKPSDYFKLRKVVIDKVKTQAIGNIYKSFFNILSKGTDVLDAQVIFIDTVATAPSYPAQEVSKMALKAARTLDDILNEVIEVILPSDFK